MSCRRRINGLIWTSRTPANCIRNTDFHGDGILKNNYTNSSIAFRILNRKEEKRPTNYMLKGELNALVTLKNPWC